ncbi:replication protein A 32 kDa subunit B-like isoform X2 [Phalaenopsis equestris]|uniref:replication protein A 32 kDa subunit B-like isoform X2 n=1 Tax=Phalaenopsis equestris TaxID=78828 RepID=UPI0009E48B47|nr:replication protein A 32 kDa subunit B-like isoform X2 [Phalaenopsis equestris]
MLSADQFAGASLFTSGVFLPSQSLDSSISPTKSRAPQTLIPITVKQLIEAYHSSEDKSTIIVDGIKLVGLVMNRMDRDTEVSFTVDDGTGQIDIRRWANESSDASDSAFIQNGVYVKVHGHLRGFQGKRHALAFSVQPLTDFNDIVLHFVECIHLHLWHVRLKGDTVRTQMIINTGTQFPNGRDYLAHFPNQFVAHSTVDGSGKDVYSLVFRVFQEPAILASEHGLHVDELFRRLNLPKNQIMDAINYLVDVGRIYSTVDEYHFKSAINC